MEDTILEKLLVIKDVCTFLNIKESALRKMIFENRIPYIKIGRGVRFKPSEIKKWIEKKPLNDVSKENKGTVYKARKYC